MNASAGSGAGGGMDSLGATLDSFLGASLQGPWWCWVLAGVTLMACWRVLRRVMSRVVPALLARFDTRVQRAPEPAAFERVQALLQNPAAGALLDWCFAGAGSGAAPLWQPGQRPAVGQRLALAVLTGPGPAAGPAALAQALALHLDGSQQLHAAGGRWAGVFLRLRVKLQNSCWWRQRRARDPWDAGYLLNLADSATQLAHLARFVPRRASLLLAEGLPLAHTLACAQALAAQQAAYDHPVRLLIVAAPGEIAALRAATLACRMALTAVDMA